MVESQPSKLLVAGSIPVSRSSSTPETRKLKFENRGLVSANFGNRVSIFSARFACGGPM